MTINKYNKKYHPEHAGSCLVLEAKQGQTWLILGWETAWEWPMTPPSPYPGPWSPWEKSKINRSAGEREGPNGKSPVLSHFRTSILSCLPLKWFTVLFYVFVNKKTRISDLKVLWSIIWCLSHNVTNMMIQLKRIKYEWMHFTNKLETFSYNVWKITEKNLRNYIRLLEQSVNCSYLRYYSLYRPYSPCREHVKCTHKRALMEF